ncbi:hypothetical protein HY468_02010 [Candidatus Roizmanbacteria bacterium]|nr:hypothetical protein [Candidatus Roizmanbacteria bacterium]
MYTERKLSVMDRIEQLLWGEKTWAMQNMTFGERFEFWRYFYLWPGNFDRETTHMYILNDIRSACVANQLECAMIKREKANKAGFSISTDKVIVYWRQYRPSSE